MADDSELLLRYYRARSDEAFAELVDRHLRMVYFTALRQVGGDTHRAQDVSQAVFTQLARKASQLISRPSIAGWLHNCTRFVAARLMRGERRRMVRHAKAQAMIEANAATSPAIDWAKTAPLIDDALRGLNDRDRELVLLRYFQESTFAEISAKMGLSADAARFRLERALERMRAGLARHGIESTSVALAIALENQAQAEIPVGISAVIARTALSVPIPTASFFSFPQILMNASKLKIGILFVTALTVGILVFQDLRQRTSLQALHEQLAASQLEIKTLNEQLTARSASNATVAGSSQQSNGKPGDSVNTSKNNPALQNLQAIQARGQLDALYGTLFKRLALPPEQLNQLKNLLIEKQQEERDALTAATRDGAFGVTARGSVTLYRMDGGSPVSQAVTNAVGPIDQQIQSLLGDSGFNLLQQYDQTILERVSVTQLQQSLSYTPAPLNDDQANELIQLLAKNSPQWARLPISSIGPLFGSQSAQITDQEITQAQGILSDQQIQALKQLQQQQQAEKQMQQLIQETAPSVGGSHGV